MAEKLRLIITDSSFILSQKGNTLVEKTFSDDGELFNLLLPELKKFQSSEIECLLSGSRLFYQTRIITYSNKEAFFADQAMVESLKETAAHAFLDENKEQKLEIISKDTLMTYSNGYPIKNISKHKTLDIKVYLFILAIRSLFLKNFGKQHIEYKSFSKWINEKACIKLNGECMVASVFEKTIDISIIKNDGFFEMLTLPIGTRQVIEHVKNGLKIEPGEAEEQISSYNAGNLSEAKVAMMDAALLSFQISLDQEVKKALNTLSNGISLPCNVYIFVSPIFAKAFDNIFKSDSYHSVCLCESGFEVRNLSSILVS